MTGLQLSRQRCANCTVCRSRGRRKAQSHWFRGGDSSGHGERLAEPRLDRGLRSATPTDQTLATQGGVRVCMAGPRVCVWDWRMMTASGCCERTLAVVRECVGASGLERAISCGWKAVNMPGDVAGCQQIVSARLDTQVARVVPGHRLRIDERKLAVGRKVERLDAAILEILVGEVRAATGAIVRGVSGISARCNRPLPRRTSTVTTNVLPAQFGAEPDRCWLMRGTSVCLTSIRQSEPSTVSMAAT